MKFYCYLLFICSLVFVKDTFGQESTLPNREFRGVWIATVFKLDWPQTVGANAQKNELIQLLDGIKDANLNAVFLQIRTECDAFYNSNFEPWSRYLAGTQGVDPGYDPLAFAIEEAHKRGLELHAWINPFRVNASTDPSAVYSNDHISQTHPEWILEFSNGRKILNPALPETRNHVASVVMDIVNNYPVDGIHFDDYFYPYPSAGFDGITNEDADDFITHGGGFSDIKDWRRHNINETIKLVQNEIKSVKPGLRFGVSPFGIWKNGVPSGTFGLDAYNRIYADATHWLQNGSVDYIVPQLYWPIGGDQDFKKLLEWWSEQAFDASRHLYAGHSLDEIRASSNSNGRSIGMLESFIHTPPKSEINLRVMQSIEEVPNQIDIVRANYDKNAFGSVFFKVTDLVSNPAGFTDNLKNKVYPYPAAPPAMDWLPGDKPFPPNDLVYQVEEASGKVTLQWTRDLNNTFDFKRYIVYRLDNATGQFPATGAIYDLVVSEALEISYQDLPVGISYWSVSELGVTNKASELSNIISIERLVEPPSVPFITLPTEQESVSSQTFTRFEWTEQPGVTSYHYQFAMNKDFNSPIEEDSQLDGAATAKLFTNLENGTYYFRIKAANEGGSSNWSPTFTVVVGNPVTSIETDEYIDHFHVYPNPSSSGTVHITLKLKKPSHLSFDMISLTGRNEITQSQQFFEQGEHRIEVDCHSLVKGFYLLRLYTSESQYTKRVVLN